MATSRSLSVDYVVYDIENPRQDFTESGEDFLPDIVVQASAAMMEGLVDTCVTENINQDERQEAELAGGCNYYVRHEPFIPMGIDDYPYDDESMDHAILPDFCVGVMTVITVIGIVFIISMI